MVLHHSCSWTVVGKHRGDDFLQGRSLCLPLGWTPFHVLSWSENNTRELCCISRSRRLYSQLLLLLSLLLPLPFIHCLNAHTLPHTLRTHTSCTALFLKGATPLLQQWQVQMQDTHRQNLNPLGGSILDFQWFMLITLALSTKKPQFASSAETRWQVILFKFPTDWGYCYIM